MIDRRLPLALVLGAITCVALLALLAACPVQACEYTPDPRTTPVAGWEYTPGDLSNNYGVRVYYRWDANDYWHTGRDIPCWLVEGIKECPLWAALQRYGDWEETCYQFAVGTIWLYGTLQDPVPVAPCDGFTGADTVMLGPIWQPGEPYN